MAKIVQQLDRVIIRFAGDSGDGMQLTGDRFTTETASFGNDLSTLPDFPAEIRAPAGTLPGVSAFQLHFADHDIMTPGDRPDVLVAMNPAALKANIGDLVRGADIIVNTDEFTPRNLTKVGYAANPLEDGSLEAFSVHAVGLTSMTVEALKGIDITKKEAERAKNMFALGLLSWLYNRPTEGTAAFLETKFARSPEILKANLTALHAGWSFGETTEDFAVRYEVKPAHLPPGRYRNISGNLALSYGLVAASQRSGLPLFLGSYPITPGLRRAARAEQAQAFRGAHVPGRGRDRRRRRGTRRGVRRCAGRDVDLGPGPGAEGGDDRARVSRWSCRCSSSTCSAAGPSTGMPTKTEQADLLQAMFGRNGEAPVPIVAPRSPSDCFDTALEAARIATTYRVPVILLSDGYLANGSEPWRVPERRRPAGPAGGLRHRAERTPSTAPEGAPTSAPTCGTPRRWPGRGRSPAPPAWSTGSAASRRPTAPATSPTTRPTTTSWSAPGRPRSTAIAASIPPTDVEDPSGRARVLVLGWGSTYGPIGAAVPPGARRRHATSRRPTCATSTRSPATSARCCAATTGCVVPGDEPRLRLGQLRCWSARSSWSTRSATTRCAGCRSRSRSWRRSSPT